MTVSAGIFRDKVILRAGPGLLSMPDDLESNKMHRYRSVVGWFLLRFCFGKRFKLDDSNRKSVVWNILLHISWEISCWECVYRKSVMGVILCRF